MKRFCLLFSLLLLTLNSWAYSLKEVTIPSETMGNSAKAMVVLPESYAQGQTSYPTVYVLHGWSGNYSEWTSKTNITQLADLYNVIVVTPDGAYDSWYIDSPVKKNSQYEKYIAVDVVNYIDKNFRTIAKKEGRSITGLSMGGFGALHVALNNPTLFNAAGSMSGGVDPRNFVKNWGLETVFGGYPTNAEFWDSEAIITNAHRFIMADLALMIDCGVDDFFINDNRALHKKLLGLNVPHVYTEQAGAHNWNYWSNAIKHQMLFFAENQKKPAN